MSRHSPGVEFVLEEGTVAKIGHAQMIVTCNDSPDCDPDHLPIIQLYVSKSTGRVVVVYEDKS